MVFPQLSQLSPYLLQEDFKRAINTLGVKYKILYYPDLPKRDRIYEGGDWSESSNDDDDLVWRSMLP